MSVWSELKRQTRITNDDLLLPPEPPVKKVVNNEFPAGTISFDIETGSVDDMFSTGPEFLRLSGYSIDQGEVVTTIDHLDVVHQIATHKGWIIGHNIMNFDAILLNRYFGMNILELTKQKRLLDTKTVCFLADPPLSRTKEGEIERIYSLDNQGKIHLGEGKSADAVTGKSVLKELAKEFGGFDKIPQDHPQYIHYLIRDVEITRDLARVIPINDYVWREHRIQAVAATISIEGFRIDTGLLRERIEQGEAKKLEILTRLMEYGLPEPGSSAAPHRTKAGINAIDTAFSDMGIRLDRTATGRPAMGKEVLLGVIERTDDQAVVDLAESVLGLNGIRTIYANIEEYLVGDRVHPSINLRQSTGRWSIQKPGLTVIGKRGGKVIERQVFLPDNEDHVLISCDLSQVDARCVAALSQDINYIKAFDPGRDVHTENAIDIFGGPQHRERAKAASHGVNYGMQAKKLNATSGMDLDLCFAFIDGFYAKFPRLKEWQDEVRIIGETQGVLYNGFGRMMKIEPERSFTQSPALMGQSTARDILCEGVLNLWDNGGEDVVRMIRGVIHDELVLSVPKKDLEEIEQLVVRSLSFEWCPIGGSIPIKIEAGLNKRGVNWADCYRKD